MKLRRALSILICAVMIFSSLAIPSAACLKSHARIRAMTWNMLAEYWGGSPTSQRSADAARLINAEKADFIAVQEFSQSWRSELMPLIPDYKIAGADDAVTAILYRSDRFTVNESGFTPYFSPSDGQYTTKRLTWAVFADKNGGELVIASNHFEWGLSVEAEKVRVAEAKTAAETVKLLKAEYKNAPMFVMGDFNTVRILAAYPTFRRESGLSDCRALAPFGDLTPTYYDNHITIDFILTRANRCIVLGSRVIDTKTARAVSDHLPVKIDALLYY